MLIYTSLSKFTDTLWIIVSAWFKEVHWKFWRIMNDSCSGTILLGLQNVITNCLLLHWILPKRKLSVLEGFSVEQNGKFWQSFVLQKCKLLHALKWREITKICYDFFICGNYVFYWLVENVPFPDTFCTIVCTMQTYIQNPLQKQTICITFCTPS